MTTAAKLKILKCFFIRNSRITGCNTREPKGNSRVFNKTTEL